jgi:hypothetical protein
MLRVSTTCTCTKHEINTYSKQFSLIESKWNHLYIRFNLPQTSVFQPHVFKRCFYTVKRKKVRLISPLSQFL